MAPVRPADTCAGGPRNPFSDITRQLGDCGWCVTPGFLPELVTWQLRHECLDAWRSGRFRPAGVGRGSALEVRPEIRSDSVLWFGDDPGGVLGVYLERLEALRAELNRTLYLGLFAFEGHFAAYPPGSYYRKHLDQFIGIGERTVTAILYLNEDWEAADGGQLRLYVDPQDDEAYVDVEPLAGRLVTFLSARFLHEVLPARRERLSVTGWFSRRGSPF